MSRTDFFPSFLVGLPLARDAVEFARERHAGQRRASDAAPFILHPLEVAALLFNTGHAEAAVVAGVLHDVVEDTDAEAADVAERFGEEVARLVAAMTEDPEIESFERRKAQLRRQIAELGPDATAVYAADKVAKVRELRAEIRAHPGSLGEDGPFAKRLDHYKQSLVMLEDQTPDHPLVRQLRFELEAIELLPPGSVAAS